MRPSAFDTADTAGLAGIETAVVKAIDRMFGLSQDVEA
jgi:hypothetical protein